MIHDCLCDDCHFCTGHSCAPCSRCGDFALCQHDVRERHGGESLRLPPLSDRNLVEQMAETD